MKPFDVYPLFDITPVSGQGCLLVGDDGRSYLDFYGGHAVISVGHSHPHYLKRISGQLDKLGYYSNSVQNPAQIELSKLLGELSDYPSYQLFMVSSGAEANENALKLASFATGRSKVLAFEGGFHGRTSGALSVTDNAKLRAPFNQTTEVRHIPWENPELLEEILSTQEYAAVIIEGIQGISGIKVPSQDFFQALSSLCTQYGTKLIVDEIQSGYARSGRFFAHQHAHIKPDLITVAKGMGNGFPVGGLLISPEFEAVWGQLGTTFGGNHLACAASLAVLEIIQSEGLLQNATDMGHYLQERLQEISEIQDIRGLGLMIGLSMDFPVKALREHLVYQEGILVGSSSDPHTLRLLPPLCVEKTHIDQFIESFKKSLKHEELLIST